jgi:hypothetical protein
LWFAMSLKVRSNRVGFSYQEPGARHADGRAFFQ